MDDREKLIRDRAYAIWQREGRPEGRESEHWQAAAREIEEELRSPGGTAAPAGAPGTGEAAGKPAAKRKTGTAGTKKTAAGANERPAATSAKKPAAKDKVPGKGSRKKTDT